MKKLFVFIITSLFVFSGCSGDDDNSFDGLTIVELEGEWVIVERREGYSPNDNLTVLDLCEAESKLIFNNIGLCTHVIANTSNEPCGYSNLSIRFLEDVSYHKIVEKIDSSNLDYSGCNIMPSTNYGKVLNLRYYIAGNPVYISDIFRKVK